MNKQHNFTSLLKNLNALADIGNHTGGHSLLESYATVFNSIMLANNDNFKQWKILLRGTFEIMAKKIFTNVHRSVYFTANAAKFLAV